MLSLSHSTRLAAAKRGLILRRTCNWHRYSYVSFAGMLLRGTSRLRLVHHAVFGLLKKGWAIPLGGSKPLLLRGYPR